jgi:hypothetical protein
MVPRANQASWYSRIQNSWHFATPDFELDALSS